MIKYHNFQPVKSSPTRHSIGGTVAFVGKRGQIVTHKNDGTNELVLATGTAGFFLERDIVSETDLTAAIKANEIPSNALNPAEFEYPYQQNGSAQATDYEEVWVEGSDLVDGLTDATTVGTEVTTAAGKFTPLTDSEAEETMGVVRAIEDAKNAAAPAKRFLISVMRGAKNIPAAP